MFTANILDLFGETIFYGTITVDGQRITHIEHLGDERPGEPYILPGFVDAHVHVESSLLTPAQFARLAVVHGTVATVSDPHEIGNVVGIEGVRYMIRDGKRVPFKFNFGAPSCVPATTFETAGATISVDDVGELLAMPEIGYLAEMMNFPGVLYQDPDVMAKIALAKAVDKPVDGHAPGLRGESAQQYIDAGITTDHECFTYDEGRDKAERGMLILIREGSAARNFEALIPLLPEFPNQIMFCSDDKHPDTLAAGHINQLVARAIAKGYDRWEVLRAACVNPVRHYHMPVGQLHAGDPADFIQVSDLTTFTVEQTVINGEVVARGGQSLIPDLRSEHLNQFSCSQIDAGQLAVAATGGTIRVIEAMDGQLITNELHLPALTKDGLVLPDVQNDVLKLVVVNRYQDAPPAVAFIRNTGLKQGALASSVGHDSHNITAVGCDDESIARVINLIIEARGGLSAAGGHEEYVLPLPVAGLMTDTDGYVVADQYTQLDQFAKQTLGSTLAAPFMTLSFMALLVIPALKLSDKGLFDGNKFQFSPLFLS